MDNWHRMDDPECQPPKDGRSVNCMVGGYQRRLHYFAGRWIDQTGTHRFKPTHWQWEPENK